MVGEHLGVGLVEAELPEPREDFRALAHRRHQMPSTSRRVPHVNGLWVRFLTKSLRGTRELFTAARDLLLCRTLKGGLTT
jgi:hypothetical protein